MSEARIAQHAIARAQRGLDAYWRGAVGWIGGDEYVVAGSHGTLYRVSLDPETCSCKDATIRGETCLHIFGCVVARAKTSAAAAR